MCYTGNSSSAVINIKHRRNFTKFNFTAKINSDRIPKSLDYIENVFAWSGTMLRKVLEDNFHQRATQGCLIVYIFVHEFNMIQTKCLDNIKNQ